MLPLWGFDFQKCNLSGNKFCVTNYPQQISNTYVGSIIRVLSLMMWNCINNSALLIETYVANQNHENPPLSHIFIAAN